MHKKNFTRFALSLVTLLAPLSAIGQDSPHIVTVSRPGATGSRSELQRLVSRLESSRLVPAVPGSWEEVVLNAARQSFDSVLRLDLGGVEPDGLYTKNMEEGDVLIARWTGRRDARLAAVWLWDGPRNTSVLVNLGPAPLTPSSLSSLCEDLFRWKEGPVSPGGMQLLWDYSSPGLPRATGNLDHEKTGYNEVFISALTENAAGWLEISLPKNVFHLQYTLAASVVPERFPPLSQRLTAYPRTALFEDLGNGYAAAIRKRNHGTVVYPKERDEIVVRELLGRGRLSDAELRQVIAGGFEEGTTGDGFVIYQRLQAFVDAVEAVDQATLYYPALARVLMSLPLSPRAQDWVGPLLFLFARRHDLDLSQTALAYVREGRFVDSSLYYLGEHGSDEQVLKSLLELSVASNLEGDQKRAIDRIRARIDGR